MKVILRTPFNGIRQWHMKDMYTVEIQERLKLHALTYEILSTISDFV